MKTNQLIQVADNYLVNTTQRITHSANQPSSPANGDLWWEPGARYPGPWEWESANSLWLCQPVAVGWNQLSLVGSGGVFTMPIEFYNVTTPKVKLVFINAYLQTLSAQSNVNYFNFKTDYLLGTAIYNTLYTWTNDTGNTPSAMNANGFRRINETPNLYFPGNAWNVALKITSFGSPGTLYISVQKWLRYARP